MVERPLRRYRSHDRLLDARCCTPGNMLSRLRPVGKKQNCGTEIAGTGKPVPLESPTCDWKARVGSFLLLGKLDLGARYWCPTALHSFRWLQWLHPLVLCMYIPGYLPQYAYRTMHASCICTHYMCLKMDTAPRHPAPSSGGAVYQSATLQPSQAESGFDRSSSASLCERMTASATARGIHLPCQEHGRGARWQRRTSGSELDGWAADYIRCLAERAGSLEHVHVRSPPGDGKCPGSTSGLARRALPSQ